jgi:hypothetical protein
MSLRHDVAPEKKAAKKWSGLGLYYWTLLPALSTVLLLPFGFLFIT